MWLKNINEITKYLPDDGLFHDVQTIGDAIYIDSEHQNPYIQGYIEDSVVTDRALTADEIKALYEKRNQLAA